MSEMKHTPLPWVTAGRNGAGDHIHGNDGEVAWCRTYVGIHSDAIKANAAFIVEACNSHYDNLATIAALKAENGRLREALDECEDYFDNRADADCDQDGFIPNKEMQLLSTVRAALTKQEG